MEHNNRTPSPSLVEQYRRQLMALYQPSPSTPPTNENWLDTRFPEPNIVRDKAAVSFPDEAPETPPQEPPSLAETPYVGYLRVFTFTGDKAEPLEGVQVAVSKDGKVYANVLTDRDGYTQAIPLPSVDPDLTLSPDVRQPYVTYDILATADGFTPVRHENVPIYGNNYVTQPVTLLPIVPGTNPNAVQDYISGGPTNL